jgi:hypothetical protein
MSSFTGGGGGVDESSLQAALAGMQLVQTSARINIDLDVDDFDADAAMAAQYLSDHDPESFPEDHVVEQPKERVLTAEEQDELDRQSLI